MAAKGAPLGPYVSFALPDAAMACQAAVAGVIVEQRFEDIYGTWQQPFVVKVQCLQHMHADSSPVLMTPKGNGPACAHKEQSHREYQAGTPSDIRPGCQVKICCYSSQGTFHRIGPSCAGIN